MAPETGPDTAANRTVPVLPVKPGGSGASGGTVPQTGRGRGFTGMGLEFGGRLRGFPWPHLPH